jgi:hypothetical protein
MKLQCLKCGRQIQVAARDILEMDLNIEPMSNADEWWKATHLACPFCTIERGGNYWLARMPARARA